MLCEVYRVSLEIVTIENRGFPCRNMCQTNARNFSYQMNSCSQPVLPEVFPQKSPVLAIFCQKRAFYRHHPCFIAFLCGNVLEKYRQMAKIGDFAHFSVLQNRRFGDKSPLLAILAKIRNLFCFGPFSSHAS